MATYVATGDAGVEQLTAERDSMELMALSLFGWPAAPHHRIWVAKIMELFRRDIRRLLIIAPPAHAKTNWAGVVAPTYYVAHYPLHHILYLSSAQGQARKSSLAVRDTIALNPRFSLLYPNVKPDRIKGWADVRWYVDRPEARGDKDPTMLAAGVGSQIVLGSRADFLEFDDICTQENVATAYRREKVKDWVRQTAFSRGARDAIHLAIGTRWHTDDIYNFFEQNLLITSQL
jgi:hypothetical protein